tara:strand:+ start:641 stop:976 length:336 start_codon:yes stop_codon:yes gene_type:complete
MPEDVTVVDLADKAGIAKDIEVKEIQGLITFDELVMNFLQQHATAKEEFNKLQEALDNMHYTSTITKISLEELQEKKDLLTRLTGAVEALALYKKHVDPNCTERDFVFNED